jgi:hypothetical protein
MQNEYDGKFIINEYDLRHITGKLMNLMVHVALCGSRARLYYKEQPVHAIWGNCRCLVWESHETPKCTVWGRFVNVKIGGTYSNHYNLNRYDSIAINTLTSWSNYAEIIDDYYFTTKSALVC